MIENPKTELPPDHLPDGSAKEVREALILEAQHIKEESLYNATIHFAQSTWMARLHYFVLGPIPIILGGLGGWKGITDAKVMPANWTIISSVLSLVAGLVGSMVSFWNLAENRMRHFSAGTSYKSLENDARRAWQVHAIDEPLPEFKKRIVELGDRYNKLNESSIQTADWAFRIARRKIKAGHFVTEAEKKVRRAKPNHEAPAATDKKA